MRTIEDKTEIIAAAKRFLALPTTALPACDSWDAVRDAADGDLCGIAQLETVDLWTVLDDTFEPVMLQVLV